MAITLSEIPAIPSAIPAPSLSSWTDQIIKTMSGRHIQALEVRTLSEAAGTSSFLKVDWARVHPAPVALPDFSGLIHVLSGRHIKALPDTSYASIPGYVRA